MARSPDMVLSIFTMPRTGTAWGLDQTGTSTSDIAVAGSRSALYIRPTLGLSIVVHHRPRSVVFQDGLGHEPSSRNITTPGRALKRPLRCLVIRLGYPVMTKEDPVPRVLSPWLVRETLRHSHRYRVEY